MNRTPEEQFNINLQWLLGELMQEHMANRYSKYQIKFELKEGGTRASVESQDRNLNMLQDRGALILRPFYDRGSNFDVMYQAMGRPVLGYYINILEPFHEIFSETNKSYQLIKGENMLDKKELVRTPIYIQNNFILKDPENTKSLCYKVKGKKRWKLLLFLCQNKKAPGPETAHLFYSDNLSLLGTEIADINKLFKAKLKESEDLIINKVGYTLNTDAYIIVAE